MSISSNEMRYQGKLNNHTQTTYPSASDSVGIQEIPILITITLERQMITRSEKGIV